MRRSPRHTLFLIAVAILLCACTKKVPLYATATQLDGVHVKLHSAHISGDRIYVKSYLTNTSDAVVRVSRDGWALRLPSGETLPRSVGLTTRHNTYSIHPGAGHNVFVDFRKEDHDLSHVTEATLIVGGTGYGTDPQPRIAGEILLSITPQMTAPPQAASPEQNAPAQDAPEPSTEPASSAEH